MVVRVVPGRDESDAEFDQFAAIELDPVDLPWRYSPTAAVGDRLQPWMALVVLKDDEITATVAASLDRKLPLVTVPGARLPDLANAWAWAHVQAIGAATQASVGTALAGPPGRLVARIFCPRRLEARTAYNAFLVPTFARGRAAGAGDSPGSLAALAPAWTTAQPEVTLPVYYQWRFLTGTVGSFEDLVKRVRPQRLPEAIGGRRMDVSEPGMGLRSAAPAPTPPATTETALEVEGALQSLSRTLVARKSAGQPFVDDLKGLLNLGTVDFGNGPVKVVVPPLYGRWPAAEDQLEAASNPPWFRELNRDPRERVGGGLGTNVIQAHQEALLAGAWEQVGNLRTVNAEKRVVQLGREALLRAFQRHVNVGRLETFLNVTGPLHGFVRSTAGNTTIFGQIAAGKVRRDLFDPQWRRLSAVRGPIGRRLGFHLAPPPGLGAVERLNTTFRPAPEPPTPAGMATPKDAYKDLVPGDLIPTQITNLVGRGASLQVLWGILLFCVARKLLLGPPSWSWWWLLRIVRFGLELIRLANGRASTDFRIAWRDGALTPALVQGLPGSSGFVVPADDVPASLPAIPTPSGSDSIDATRFKTALGQLFGDLTAGRLPLLNLPLLNLTSLRTLLASRLDPRTTLTTWITSRVVLLPTVPQQTADPLEPYIIAPDFPQPMWVPLRDLSEEWIVPGLSGIATDTLGLLVPNQRFIEAYMVGLNHEMARELLWNEYPADQRATMFRQFWETRGYVRGPGDPTDPEVLKETFRDIKQVHLWQRTAPLGQNSPRRRAPGESLVLLVRAELIHRFPNVIVYAVNALPPATPTAERYPVYSGRLGQDTAYYGFELSAADVHGANPTWYFVLQEQPAEPRFHVPPTVTVAPGEYLTPAAIGASVATSAHFAVETFRAPTRVAVPAASMVPAE